MSEEPRPGWLPPQAPGARPPREWRSLPEPAPGSVDADRDPRAQGDWPRSPESTAGRRAEGAAPGPPPAPFASAHPPSTAPDPRDWWRGDRAAGGGATTAVPARRPVARSAGNGQALASLVLGIAGLVLFFASGFGLVFILNLPCSILAWVLGVQGRRKVDRGETAERRGMAQAGMLLGLVGTVIGGLAIIAWALGFLLSDDLRDQFQREWERRQNA